jgi:hypothetical protein
MNDIWLNPMTARADSWVKLDSHVENVVQNFGRRYRVPEERCDDIKQGMMLSLIVLSKKSEEVPKPESGSPGIPYVNTMVKNRFIDGFRGRRTFVEWKTAHHDLFETPETQTVTIAMYGEVARTLKKVIQTYWMGEDRDRHFQKIYDLACYTAVYLQGLRITHPGTNKIDVLLAG